MKRLPRTIPMFFMAFGLVVLAAHAFAVPSPFPPISAAQALANKGQTMTVEGVALHPYRFPAGFLCGSGRKLARHPLQRLYPVGQRA